VTLLCSVPGYKKMRPMEGVAETAHTVLRTTRGDAMMKRVIIGLIALAGLALWWTDARAQCAGGVGAGGSCVTRGLLGRSLGGVTRSIDPGASTFEFFGTLAPSCNHNFTTGVLDCDCRIRGTAYCSADSGTSSLLSASSSSSSNHDDDDDGGNGSKLKTKAQTLAAGIRVNNIGNAAATTASPGGDQGFFTSYWAIAELEPHPDCVDCPPGAPFFITFFADTIVMRSTFCPNGGGPCHTSIQVCTGGRGLSPTQIESYDCTTRFQCVQQFGGQNGVPACPGCTATSCPPDVPYRPTSGTCGAACEPSD
jgi:hypothetical protein